jgi:hypothetical protein
MPASAPSGWKRVVSQDFTTAAAIGSFNSKYSGWSGYDTYTDTSRTAGRPAATQGTYMNGTQASVANGLFDCYIKTVGTKPTTCALTVPNSSQKYGRYTVRWKTDSMPGYKFAWLLWPSSENWDEGEVDFPEGDLAGQIEGYSHDNSGNPSNNAFSANFGVKMPGAWHTTTIEWKPGSLSFILDGKANTTTNSKAIPKTNFRWVLQTESQIDSRPPSTSVSGHYQIDWITMDSYAG